VIIRALLLDGLRQSAQPRSDRRAREGRRDSLPPGPRLPAAVQTLLFVRDPVRFFERCQSRYGKAVTVNLLGFGRTVWVTDPALVRRVIASPEELRAGEAANVAEPIFGSHSVVTSDGEAHAERRGRLRPSFHSRHVAGYETTFRRAALAEISDWRAGDELPLLPAIYRITMEVILEAVLGVEDPDRRREVEEAVVRVAAMGNEAALGPAFGPAFRLDAGRGAPGGRFRRRLAALDELIAEEVARARHDGGERDDVAAMLTKVRRADGSPLPDEELRDELVGLMIAGQETTGTALAWTFDLLLRHPKALERVVAETGQGEGAYTDAAISESLRLRPPVIAAARIAATDLELDGWRIDAGTRMWTPMTLIQRRADLFPEPESFRPERFLGSKADPFTWIPFGGGNRRCIGAGFALLEMRTVLQTVLSHVRMRPAFRRRERTRLNNVIMEPARGMRILVESLDQDA
jgi:cytochrome P450